MSGGVPFDHSGTLAPHCLQPGQRVGPYILNRPIGSGSFGLVWEARREGALATIKVALKFPRNSAVDLNRVRREAEVWAKIGGHPNILPIIDADIYDEHVVLASEYIPDGSLLDWLTQHHGRSPSIAAAAEVMLGILAGLEYLHALNIIHRDLKPSNILLYQGIPRLADFGLAIPQATSNEAMVGGTPLYMAPESFAGQFSEHTDLWSAAVIFYQMLSGQMPFPQTDLNDLAAAIRAARPLPLSSETPTLIAEVALRPMRRDPSQRFRTAADMRAALRIAIRNSIETISSPSSARPAYRTVAITGSMHTDPSKAEALIRTLAAPYISPYTTWYCGTYGTVDEVAAAYLVEQKQRLIAVGYHGTDISPRMNNILNTQVVPVVDAMKEEVPAMANAPTKRDIYFCTKADLVILLHDGNSMGTIRLINWLKDTSKDHLVGYV